jgi:hypothetical protein
MLKTKELKVMVRGNVCQYYKENNIDVEFNKENIIPIDKVNPNSHLMVDVVCDVCGKELKTQFRRYNKSLKNGGYYSCSSKCSGKKRKLTNKKKYGVSSYTETDEFKRKSKSSTIEKWGVEHFRQSEKWKNNLKDEEVKIRKNTMFNQFLDENNDIIGHNDFDFIGVCEVHGEYHIPKYIYHNRKINKNVFCVGCNPISKNISGKEIYVRNFIEKIYDGEVISNYKVDGREIDIYLPKLNIGVEFNGLRWHSEQFNNSHNMLDKTLFMGERGIRIFHIFEDDFDYKWEIIKSMISNLLGKTEQVIYGRKTTIKKIENKNIVKKFLNENHLQGYYSSRYNYGLYYHDELISVMTFSKLRKVLGHKENKDKYELLRFCNKLNTTVIGGASKLLKFMIKDMKPSYILSYSDKMWATGGLYENIGFEFKHSSKPNYWYVYRGVRYSRLKYQKHKLINMGFDKKKTEKKIMEEDMNMYRIYNCGNNVYEMFLSLK